MPPGVPAWRTLLEQVTHFFALMLWVAAALAFVAALPQLGLAIVVIVLVNGLFAFVQEHRAERAADRLRDLLPRRAMVRRDGRLREIDAEQLVRDDLVVLAAGDRISADLRVLEAHALAVDTAALTGESVPVQVDSSQPVYAGTFVTDGEGLALVTATGHSTRLADIARLTRRGRRPPSPLARELQRLVRTIAAVAILVGLTFFGVALALGFQPGDGFLFAIGVTVALVPEGLLPTMTLSLAIGAQRMAGRQALVRRLESVETLGSTTFICTDKTGTLTVNQMAVVAVWTPAGEARVEGRGYEPDGQVAADPIALPALRALALAAARCSSGHVIEQGGEWVPQGDPMEAALDVLARRLGLDPEAEAHAEPITRRYPFDPRRRRMSVLVGDWLLVKGAPDAVLPRCVTDGSAMTALDRLAARGLRVIAVARRSAGEVLTAADPDEVERGLELLGLVGLEDPPRPGAAEAIAACRRAGIKVGMITGDHPMTARSIALELGLAGEEPLVLEGRELPPDERVLGELLDRDGVVVSRVSPEDKLRIARALRARGHVVAMTGDGVNDGPALQEADIGIAMGRGGTDVAREASDLVLLDDDFATIVAAVEQGRATFANMRRFLTYHLTDNVAELTPFVVWALSGGSIPLALGVLQILSLDVVTDQLPALGLGAEPPGEGLLDQPPRGRHLIDRSVLWRVFGLLGPVEAFFEMAAFGVVLVALGWQLGAPAPPNALLAASGAAFAAVILGQAANGLACRSNLKWAGAGGWWSNPLLLAGIAVEIALLLAFLYVEPIAAVLGQAPPPPIGWGVALLTAPALIAVDALQKSLAHRRLRHSAAPARLVSGG